MRDLYTKCRECGQKMYMNDCGLIKCACNELLDDEEDDPHHGDQHADDSYEPEEDI